MSGKADAGAPPHARREGALAFVRAAELASNTYDASGAAALYAPGATLEVIINGVHDRHRGQAAISAAWLSYFQTLRAPGFQLSKRLVAVDEQSIVTEWSGGPAGRCGARGLELWTFDRAGLVVEHRMLTFLDVQPASSALGRLRLGMARLRAAPFVARTRITARRTARWDQSP